MDRNDKYLMESNKLIWHMDRVHEHFRDGKRISPIHIDIGATKLCNCKCVYCFGIQQKMNGMIMPKKSIINLFKDAPELGVKSLAVTGDGEPTLNPYIYEAIEKGKDKGLDIGFATNGIKLDKDKLRVLLKNCVWLRFNLSAGTPQGYKTIHRVDKWDIVTHNIEMATQLKRQYGYNCTIGLQMVLVPQAFNEIIPEANFAIRNKVDYFVIKQFSDPGCKEMSQFNLDWYDNEAVMETLKTAESMSNDITKIIPKWKIISLKGQRPYDRCVDCALIFQVSGNGKCYPCGYLFNNDKYCYGDLNKQTLKEILESDRYWNIVKYMREDFNVHKDCQGACRHDSTNNFIWNYLNKPDHINFI